MTDPPDDSTAVVSWETAVPLAGTSSLTVIEYETLGAVAMAESFAFLKLHCFASGTLVPVTLPDRRTYRLVAVNDCHLSESIFHHTRSHPFGGTPNRLRPPSTTLGNDNRPAPPTGDAGLSFTLSGTDPPCSPRGKWSLEATKVGPGGLDRAGASTTVTKTPEK
ncbi:hypothetical protein GCM10010498_26530 [Streptomyces cavourensis]|nr:hypothetical protein GCM10010498_26530 [Streptomyces cavourensis]